MTGQPQDDPGLARIIQLICEQAAVDAIYLYGSRAKGYAREDSDWDIAVLFTHFEPDILERALKPQRLEAELERQCLDMEVSVVDMRAVPVPLQWNIIQGIRLYDRGVPAVRRMEHAIISAWENYEQTIDGVQQEMLLVLDDLHADLGTWKNRDILAAQRALQVLIESLIGLSRYVYQQKYGISVNKSRAGLDGLAKQGDLPKPDYELSLKMIGFRNVLVHDYLNVNINIIEAIVQKRLYQEIKSISERVTGLLLQQS